MSPAMKRFRGLLIGVLPALAVAGMVASQTLQGGWLGPAGSNGQVQVNSNGQLGGITIGGDASLNASTGALTVTTLGGLTPATIPSAPTTGHCVSWLSATTLGDAGAACGSGGAGASLSAANTWTVAGAASTAAELFNGALFTGGTATTTYPFWYIDTGATEPINKSTSGTYWGVNAPSGFLGNFFQFWVNGTSEATLTSTGTLNLLAVTATGNLTAGATGVLQLNGRGQISSVAANQIGWGSTTVAALASCVSGIKGERATVTDATSPTYLGTLTGGGAVVAGALCNGTAWVAD